MDLKAEINRTVRVQRVNNPRFSANARCLLATSWHDSFGDRIKTRENSCNQIVSFCIVVYVKRTDRLFNAMPIVKQFNNNGVRTTCIIRV